MPRKYIVRPVESRLWHRGQRTETGCLVWPGALNSMGYGQIRIDYKAKLVHRVAWELTYGPIPPGLWVLHRCDNPPCFDPEHLFLGNARDNMQDMVSKGRQWLQKTPERAHRGVAHGNALLTDDIVREIRRLYSDGGTLKQVAAVFGIHFGTVWQVVNRKTWAHVV